MTNADGEFGLVRILKAVGMILILFVVTSPITILSFCAGTLWVYKGICNGRLYPTLAQSPMHMTVTRVENRNHRTILPDYFATGTVSNRTETIGVSIFREQYRVLRRGSSLDVYQLPSGEWVNSMLLDEAKPILHVGGLHFTWQFIAGLVALLYGVLSLYYRLVVRKHRQTVRRE